MKSKADQYDRIATPDMAVRRILKLVSAKTGRDMWHILSEDIRKSHPTEAKEVELLMKGEITK